MKENKTLYDVLIIGGGPAGMSAALYLARTRYKFAIITNNGFGGKLLVTTRIDNYPGVIKSEGVELALKMSKQIQEMNVESINDEILELKKEKEIFKLTGKESTYEAKQVIIATGSFERKSRVEGLDRLTGRGVSFCAVCDGFFFKNKEVAVFANEREGYLEALYLTNLVSKIYLINDNNKDDSLFTLKQLKESKNVKFYHPYKIVKYNGEEELESIEIKNINTNEVKTLKVAGCFPFEGKIPSNYFLSKLKLEYDKFGYIKVNENMLTSIDGLYAAGDIIVKPLKQVVTACSDGAIAATAAIKYLNQQKRK